MTFLCLIMGTLFAKKNEVCDLDLLYYNTLNFSKTVFEFHFHLHASQILCLYAPDLFSVPLLIVKKLKPESPQRVLNSQVLSKPFDLMRVICAMLNLNPNSIHVVLA